MRVAGLGLGLVDIGQDLLAALQVALAGLGQRDAPRGAIQEARAQVRFQVRYRPRGVGGRRIELLGGRGETARIDHAHEHTHVLKRIHTDSPFNAGRLLHRAAAILSQDT